MYIYNQTNIILNMIYIQDIKTTGIHGNLDSLLSFKIIKELKTWIFSNQSLVKFHSLLLEEQIQFQTSHFQNKMIRGTKFNKICISCNQIFQINDKKNVKLFMSEKPVQCPLCQYRSKRFSIMIKTNTSQNSIICMKSLT